MIVNDSLHSRDVAEKASRPYLPEEPSRAGISEKTGDIEKKGAETSLDPEAIESGKDPTVYLLNRKVEYQVVYETQEIIIKVINEDTGEVIRQIPQEDFLRFAHSMTDTQLNELDAFA